MNGMKMEKIAGDIDSTEYCGGCGRIDTAYTDDNGDINCGKCGHTIMSKEDLEDYYA